MARLPDLQLFAAEHGLKIGTIADLIEYRSRHESLVERIGSRPLHTAHGEFTAHAFRDAPSQTVHLALVKGQWSPDDDIPVRVHEPLSVLDALEVNRAMHSWSLDASLSFIHAQGRGVAVLLNCGESADQLLAQFEGRARSAQAPERGKMDLRTYGVGAQILRECGVQKNETHGPAPPHAQHDRLRPRNHRLHSQGITMQGANQGQAEELDGQFLHIGIVQARFNEDITNALAKACIQELEALGVSSIDHVMVPGALEVPVALQAMAERAEYDALIALGCIIRGETYHFELVANESGAGVSRVSLDYNLPIANAILTTENLAQAVARQTEKGRDAARVAVEMACIMDDLSADMAEELDDEEGVQ